MDTEDTPPSEQDQREEILKNIAPRKRRWPWVLLALLLIAALGTWAFVASRGKGEVVRYQTEPVTRGDVVLSATSTGNLEPRRQVTIGAEISGQVTEVLVEENDPVTVGQELAKIDTSRVEDERVQLRAQLAGSQANVRRAQATLDESQLNVERLEQLVERGASPQSSLDQARAALARAKADLASTKADVSRVNASYKALDQDISRAIITSPIDGVVLLRAVEPGSTVAASFQAPELFVLAEDLSRMELHVLINEADISLVKPEQHATFSVDAWPERTFDATVKSVSLSPTINDNVVTYKTILEVDNSERLLRPGMTATTTIQTGKRENVLRVPMEALWFTPPQESSGFQLGPRRRDRAEKQGSAVHVLRAGQPTRISLKLGRSDGEYIEVLDGDLKPDDEVVTGVISPEGGKPGKPSEDQDNPPPPPEGGGPP